MNHPFKNRRILEAAMSFWAGVGLMSIINVWKISQGIHPLTYSRIMFAVAVFFLVICLIFLLNLKQRSK